MEGTLDTTAEGRFALRFERRLAHPPGEVWHALTDPKAMREWFPQEVEADLRPGGKMRFRHRRGEVYEDLPVIEGEVLEYDPPRLFAYTWGADMLRWELRPDGDGCLLVFTDTFGELGKAARDGAGWHVCLEALVASLDGTRPPPRGRWQQVHPGYVERLGPEASTIGPPEVG
ncbi:MAG: SRPBCC family protein [Streptosporangiaceae bacterium]|nr:SRPBCC family protein [Streptosporangiaceae bacterium]